MNRFDFVHEQIQKQTEAKMTELDRWRKERRDELVQLANEADLQMDMRRRRKERSQGLRNG